MGEILSTLKRKLLIDCNSLSTNLSKYPEKRRKTQKGLFRKRALQKRLCCAKETYNFIDFTNRSHPMCVSVDSHGPLCLIFSALQHDVQQTAIHCNTLQHTVHRHVSSLFAHCRIVFQFGVSRVCVGSCVCVCVCRGVRACVCLLIH